MKQYKFGANGIQDVQHSKVVGTSEIKDYELEFRGVCNNRSEIRDARVPVTDMGA